MMRLNFLKKEKGDGGFDPKNFDGMAGMRKAADSAEDVKSRRIVAIKRASRICLLVTAGIIGAGFGVKAWLERPFVAKDADAAAHGASAADGITDGAAGYEDKKEPFPSFDPDACVLLKKEAQLASPLCCPYAAANPNECPVSDEPSDAGFPNQSDEDTAPSDSAPPKQEKQPDEPFFYDPDDKVPV